MLAIEKQFGSELKFMLDGHMGNWPDINTAWNFETASFVIKANV